MLKKPNILFAKTMHKRLFPKVNAFVYGVYYLALPLSQLQNLTIPYNRPGLLSFYDKDHGARDGSNLESWASHILKQYGITQADGEIMLICMPRILGYVFNPVSFWLCYDRSENLRAVLCEVNNTFGETHTYLCAHPDQRPIKTKDTLRGEKLFHVSPFMQREGHYEFRFDIDQQRFNAWIDFYNQEGKKQLITSLNGDFTTLSKKSLRKAFWGYPLVTLKTIALIHWQAFKLVLKGISYVPKPAQKKEKLSATENLTKV